MITATQGFVPVDPSGNRPWMVRVNEWGRMSEKKVVAKTATHAEQLALGGLKYSSAQARWGRYDD